ncbi:Universal stress protein family protein [Thalassovita gelatinovora]|uniref:Universal stress protein family protein n=1 Tax=Thalassovita gelatinovora TaxID=53501 RepID=A0A0N7LW54_THAGE|nr:universal stress protein [Thalassovita gelatinovora]QIZ81654.1 universal stress protein [Thalassovita gelatinovora]CUH68146.1 Universal stress protein family protein [Thalassovita gelatinovora]SEQ30113.1 Universal stress protein family protein [Thalassovita gelatinovora]
MAYKTLFTVLTNADLINPVLEKGIELANAYDAHFDVLCLGVDRTQTGYYYAGANAMVLQETITRANDEAKEIEAKVKKRLGNSDIRWNTDLGVAQLADIGRHVAAHARFADLVLLPQPYGENRGAELEPIVEAAMFDGKVPVLVLPENGGDVTDQKRITIAWNESNESMAAVRAAMPLLKEAISVRVVVIDPPAHGPNRSDPGGQLSQFLARHGIRAEIDVLSKTLPRISDVILRHATDTDADMLVMGAYGHSRFREAILGGATRDMLEKAKLPVFMAH